MTPMRFEGKGSEYFKIWIVNILLMIVTVGLFYPWAKVRNKRYFYANSTLEDQNFEYHATGKQLFIGFLISIVLLLIYVGVQQVSPEGSLVVVLIFFLAFPWIIWRSLKFNMHVTSFSNVRFGFDGKVGGAYFNYMLLPILFFLCVYGLPIAIFFLLSSFGLSGNVGTALAVVVALAVLALAVYLFALMKKRNTKYVIDGSRYGQGEFSADLEVKPFAIILLKTIGLFFLAYIGIMLIAGLIAMVTGLGANLMQLAPDLKNPEALAGALESPIVMALIALVYIALIVIGIGLFAYSHARQRAYIYDNTMLDGKIAFKSTLGARKFAWVSMTNLLLVIFTLGLATPYAKVRIAKVMLENTHVDTSQGFQGYLTAQQKVQSSLGEQIGDAFDVDVGIGL